MATIVEVRDGVRGVQSEMKCNVSLFFFYLFLLGSEVAGPPLSGGGGFFHTKVSILLTGPVLMAGASSRACKKL